MTPTSTIVFCMTSDFAFDQRMQRVVSTLSIEAMPIIIHRKKNNSPTLPNFRQISVATFFKKGILFYIEFNAKLFFLLLRLKGNYVYLADTDTLAAGGMASYIISGKFILDQHELFTEVPELAKSPIKKKCWALVEHLFTKRMQLCLTVGEILAKIYSKKHQTTFHTIKNVPNALPPLYQENQEKLVIYQGAVNQGRGLHCAIDAMEFLPEFHLLIIGNGDITQELKLIAAKKSYHHRIVFKPAVLPQELQIYTKKAMFGLNLIEKNSLSYYYSLANKFFDYLQAEIPSINMKFPEYENILNKQPFGIMINQLDPKELAQAITNNSEKDKYLEIKQLCKQIKAEYTWEKEGEKLLSLFRSL